jgi:hypothetical protein
MAEFLKDGFIFYDGFFNKPVFNLDNIDIEKKIKYIQDNDIKNISIDITIEDFSFIKEISFVEEIYISRNVDKEKLYLLKDVKRIVVNIEKGEPNLNFSKFPKLEILSIDWHKNFPDLSKNFRLKDLSIWKFKPATKSFAEIKLPNSLQKLHITESNIINLEGLNLNHLEEFQAHYCNSLKSLNGIKYISDSLEILILDYCRKLDDYDEIKVCTKLNKLVLGDCGPIPTLKWLSQLSNVKHFSFYGTKLVDGDTSPCLTIDFVSFQNEKHYNHKIEEFT